MNKYEMKEEVVYTAKIRNEKGIYIPVLVYREGSRIKEYYTGKTICTIIQRKVDITKMLEKKHRLVFYRDKYVDENGQTRYRLLQANIGVINTYKEQARKGKNLFIRTVLGISPKTENELFIGYLDEKTKILFYKDDGEIKEYKTDMLIPEKLIKNRLIAPKGSIREYKGYKKEELEEILERLQKTKLSHRIRKQRLELLLKIKDIYVATIRIINEDQCLENFQYPIDEKEKRYKFIPGSTCEMEDNLPLFPKTVKKRKILIYKTLFGYKELLTGISITGILGLDYSDPDTEIDAITLLGKSGPAFIKSEELVPASKEEMAEYIKCPIENMETRLVSIFIEGEQAYYEAINKLPKEQQPRQLKRKIGEKNDRNR